MFTAAVPFFKKCAGIFVFRFLSWNRKCEPSAIFSPYKGTHIFVHAIVIHSISVWLHVCTPRHTHTYIYIYIYMTIKRNITDIIHLFQFVPVDHTFAKRTKQKGFGVCLPWLTLVHGNQKWFLALSNWYWKINWGLWARSRYLRQAHK